MSANFQILWSAVTNFPVCQTTKFVLSNILTIKDLASALIKFFNPESKIIKRQGVIF
jgi:hypothetical protein